MFKRFSIHLAVIFLFAFAQIGAVTHSISHVNNFTTHSQDDKKPHSEQCEQCISFAKIAGGLTAQSFEFPIVQARFISSTQLQTQATSQLLSAYAARAPPTTTYI
jgi:Holliday junction resolvase